jgi:hypothetical protein
MGDIGKPVRETERPAPVRAPPPEPRREPAPEPAPEPVKAPPEREPAQALMRAAGAATWSGARP